VSGGDRSADAEGVPGEGRQPEAKPGGGGSRLRGLLWLPVPFLLAWALRGVPLREAGRILGGLNPGRLAVLGAVNLAFTAVLTLRWVSILRGLGERTPLRNLPGLAAARLAGFAVSYLTPGPQFGGEPAQLALARSWTGLTYARGAASLVIEKSMDLAGNLAFIGLGMLALRALPSDAAAPGRGWTFLSFLGILLGILPLVYLGSVFAGLRPLSALAARAIRLPRPAPRLSRLADFIRDAEAEAGAYGRNPVRAAAQLVLPFFAIQGFGILELWLTMSFLGAPLDFGGTVLLLAGGKLALYAPVPGGLGALEAAQRALVTLLGYGPETALALSAWVRIRDLLFALAGLAAAARAGRPPRERR